MDSNKGRRRRAKRNTMTFGPASICLHDKSSKRYVVELKISGNGLSREGFWDKQVGKSPCMLALAQSTTEADRCILYVFGHKSEYWTS